MGYEGIVLRGRVITGRGEGELYVNLYAKQFERALGFRPYPGTLDILLEDPLKRRALSSLNPILVNPPRGFENLVPVKCYPAELRGLRVYVVEPMLEGYDYRVLELIAEVYLRGALGLRDGELVEVLVNL